jgi:hypothetical protein
MSYLLDIIKTSLEKKSLADLYKENTMYFYEKYNNTTKEILNIPLNKIQLGGFYFMHYEDDSNWLKYSPVFVCDFKKLDNQIVIFAMNFNLIPLEIRYKMFDKFISKDDVEKNNLLKVSYKNTYNELKNIGFEYALMEYNLSQVKLVHKINMSIIDKFLISGHPINVYDPNKLYSIYQKKLKTRDKREQEMMKAILSDFYDIKNEISKEYEVLKDHIKRTQSSYKKYG